LLFAVFGVVDDRGLPGQILHTFLCERSPNEVSGKTFQGLLLMGIDPFAAEDVKAGVSPALHHTDELPGDFPFTEEHGKHAVAEQLLQVLQVEPWGDPEQPLAVKTPVRNQDMQMGMIAVRPLTKSLRGHDGPKGSPRCGHCGVQERLKRFPGAAAKRCQKLAIVEEEAPEDLGD
jgi:hypothetical protein